MTHTRNDDKSNNQTATIVYKSNYLFLSSNPSIVYGMVPFLASRSCWDNYKILGENYSDKYKVHVSLELDNTNFQQTKDFILNILLNHAIASFKFITLEDVKRLGNNLGKELVIYMQLDKASSNESKPDFWRKIFNELEAGLQTLNVVPNKTFKPQGDKLLSGSNGYIYFRNSYNLLDRYVSINALSRCDFTLDETYNLNGDNKIETLYSMKTVSELKQNNKASAISVNLYNRIIIPVQHLQADDLKMQSDQVYERLKNDLIYDSVFFGTVSSSEQHKEPFESIAILFKFAMRGGVGGNYKISDLDKDKLKGKTQNLAEYYKDCLAIAIKRIVIIKHFLQLKEYRMGSIYPAVYWHFFKPIVSVWKIDSSVSFEGLVNKKQFIDEIIKCSFRDKAVNQLELEKPKYINNLDEDTLNELIYAADIFSQKPKEFLSGQIKQTMPAQSGLFAKSAESDKATTVVAASANNNKDKWQGCLLM
jgi:hypothetical protein